MAASKGRALGSEGRLVHGELTYQIIGALMRVLSELGPGWLEADYHQCSYDELKCRGLSVQRGIRGRLDYKGVAVGLFQLDLLVENAVVIELKHAAQGFCSAHHIQLINYLRYWNKEVGLLGNFAQESLRTKRLLNTRSKPAITNATRVAARTTHDSSIAGTIQAILNPIIDEGLFAYDLSCLLRMFQREAICQGRACKELTVRPRFGSTQMPSRSVKALQLDDDVAVLLGANPSGSSPQDRARLQSYARHAGFARGVLVNFGSTEVSISIHKT